MLVAIPLMLLLMIAVVYQYGYLQVRTAVAEREDVASVKLKLLQKQLSLIADKPRLESELTVLREIQQGETAKIIEGQTATIAAAALQSHLDALIASMGGSVASKRVEKIEDAGPFKVITVAVDAVLPDTRALSDALYAIESQIPSLVVRELEVRIRAFKEPRELSVKLRVSGLTRGVPS
jgi:DNA-binding Lrp family transcriptional regulator